VQTPRGVPLGLDDRGARTYFVQIAGIKRPILTHKATSCDQDAPPTTDTTMKSLLLLTLAAGSLTLASCAACKTACKSCRDKSKTECCAKPKSECATCDSSKKH
jgi:hypothetical protein